MNQVRQEPWLRAMLEDGIVHDHVLHEVLLQEVGTPIQDFANARQAVNALHCALQGTHACFL